MFAVGIAQGLNTMLRRSLKGVIIMCPIMTAPTTDDPTVFAAGASDISGMFGAVPASVKVLFGLPRRRYNEINQACPVCRSSHTCNCFSCGHQHSRLTSYGQGGMKSGVDACTFDNQLHTAS